MKHKRKTLMLASVASMIDQFNLPNIRLMQRMGCEVHVACNFKTGNTCDRQRIRELLKLLAGMGAVCHQWDCPRDIHPAAGCLRAYRQLWELTGRHHYEWLHCHSPVGGALARLVAQRRGLRVIYTAHGFHFYQGAPWKNWLLYYPAEKLLSYATDVLVTVNSEDYLFAKKNMKAQKVCRIPGVGVDLEKFASGSDCLRGGFSTKYHLPDGAKILLSVGELNAGKNHRAVIEALAALKRQDVYYIICGQGALRDELERCAGRLGVADRIRMPGYQEDMPYIYQNADIFVFPSIREGMPVALIEAMAAGLPCIVSNIRGNRELISDVKDGCVKMNGHAMQQCAGGIRFSPGQPGQLQKALEILLDHPRMRKECGRHNQMEAQKYAQAAVQERMRKIYAYIDTGCHVSC